MLQHWGERDACTRDDFLSYVHNRQPRYRANLSEWFAGVLGSIVAIAHVWAAVSLILR